MGQLQKGFFNRILGNQLVDRHLLLLPNPVGPVGRLVLRGHVPPWVNKFRLGKGSKSPFRLFLLAFSLNVKQHLLLFFGQLPAFQQVRALEEGRL